MKQRPKLVALAGSSGAGKSWLSHRLQAALKVPATHLPLNDFHRDQLHLPPPMRGPVNYDHPRAVDWRLAETLLLEGLVSDGVREGRERLAPRHSPIILAAMTGIEHSGPQTIPLRRPRVHAG